MMRGGRLLEGREEGGETGGQYSACVFIKEKIAQSIQ